MVFGFTPAGAAFLATVGFLVHGRPSPAFSFVFRDAAPLVTFLDVLSHPFLLASVAGFVSTGHLNLHFARWFVIKPEETSIVPKPAYGHSILEPAFTTSINGRENCHGKKGQE
jgi:hypothetical protein